MNLDEIQKELQSEYDKLISELDNLKRLYQTIKPKYQKMETKDLELYYELEDLSEELKKHTEIDQKNEKEYIKNNSNKLALKLPFTCGIILPLLMTIISILRGNFLNNITLSIGLIIGHFNTGIIIGLAIYTLYKKKYASILKERYKHTEEHLEYSKQHYDKQLSLMRKKEDYNNYYKEYQKVKEEYINIERSLNQKKEELNLFKDKVFNILFPNGKDDITRNDEETISKYNIPCYDEYIVKEESSPKKILKKF